MGTEEVQFGRYRLLRKIATGGMAEIFLAKQQGPGRFERTLVIKRILPHLAQDPKFIGMFLDEAALAAQLSHPHIAQLYDFGDEGGQYYLALELVRGPDLASIIDACRNLGRPPPPELSVRLVSQMLEALHYAHGAVDEKGMPFHLVHRDVSPQNVLCSVTGVVKLIDFGIAKATSAMQRTDAGMVKGKFTYMAPEQLRGEPLDGRCDLYAAALVLYELLSLEVALQGEGPAAISNALEARIKPLGELRPDLPADLLEAMGRALRKNRNERFADCAEFGGTLEKILASKGAMVQSAQIADYLKSLEEQLGHPLSPVGLGSSSGEKVPPAAEGRGSGPHDTAISGPAAIPSGLDATSVSPVEIPGRAPVRQVARSPSQAPPRPQGSLSAPKPPPERALPMPVRGPQPLPQAAPRSSQMGRWVALVLCLVALVAGATGWRWYNGRESSKALAEVVPDKAPVDAPLPDVPAAPRQERPALTVATSVPDVRSPGRPLPERHPHTRSGKHGARERPERGEKPGSPPESPTEAVAAESPAPSPAPKPAVAPTPNYQQVAPPNYQQQSPYYQNGYYQQGYQYPYQYQQPQQQQGYPYGQQPQQAQQPQQQYQYPQQGYQR
jgi:serine/threonine-protein kinase